MIQEKAMNMSNKQAIQILMPMRNMMCDQHGCPISDAVFALDKAIEALSIEKPQGEWTNAGVLTAYCSNCKSEFHELEAMNYCPQCGARMKGAIDGNK